MHNLTKRIAVVMVASVSLLLIQVVPAQAWKAETNQENNQFILTTFSDLNGSATDVRPAGKRHYQIAIVCTKGFFEIDLFELTTQGLLAVFGVVEKVTIQSGSGKGRIVVNSEMNGPDAIRISDPKVLHKWLIGEKRIGVRFVKSNGSVYMAYFDVSNLSKFTKSFRQKKCMV